MKLAHMIRVWASVNGVEHAKLADEWQCSASTVTRFLRNEQSPDGPTMGRIIAWVLGEQPAPVPVDTKELERRIDRLERLYQGDRAAVQAASMFIPIGAAHDGCCEKAICERTACPRAISLGIGPNHRQSHS